MEARRAGLLPLQRRHGLRRRPARRAVTLPDGRIWRNIVPPRRSKVAETLAEFRGQFAYNLLDDNLRAFAARVPADQPVGRPRGPQQLVPGRDPRRRPLHREATSTCSPRARGRRSSSSCRSRPAPGRGRIYRGSPTARCSTCSCSTCARTRTRTTPTVRRPDARAPRRRAARLAQARAVALHGDLEGHRLRPAARARRPGRPTAWEAVAQGDPGAPLGRELEIAEVLRYAHRTGVTGTSLAHRRRALHRRAPLRPRARRVHGLHAVLGVRLRPAQRRRVRPERARRHVRPGGGVRRTRRRANTSPLDGFQYFGEVAIDGGPADDRPAARPRRRRSSPSRSNRTPEPAGPAYDAGVETSHVTERSSRRPKRPGGSRSRA